MGSGDEMAPTGPGQRRMLAPMRSEAGENALGARVALPGRALAGSAGAKGLEALTLAGLVLLVPRALGPADYGGFAVALAIATGISTATGLGGPALFARVLGPLTGPVRRDVARALAFRLGAARGALLGALTVVAVAGVAAAPGRVSAGHAALVLAAAVLGTGATLLSQLALGLERTAAWSLRYPLENGVIVAGALVLYPIAGLGGAIAAIALGAAASLALGVLMVGQDVLGSAGAATGGEDARGADGAAGGADVRGSAGAAMGGEGARGAAGAAMGGEAVGGTRGLPAGVVRFARLQALGGALTQAVHRGAAPACALLGVGAAATGHAAIAAGAALAITYAVTQTTLVALPGAARAFAGDEAGAEGSLRRVAALAALVVVPCCAALALVAEPLLAAGLGEEFRDAAPALRIALAAAALAPLWALSTQLAVLRGRPEAVLAGAAGGASMFAVVAAITLPEGGASAACAAMFAGVAAMTAGTFAVLRAGQRGAAMRLERGEGRGRREAGRGGTV